MTRKPQPRPRPKYTSYWTEKGRDKFQRWLWTDVPIARLVQLGCPLNMLTDSERDEALAAYPPGSRVVLS